MRQKRVLLINPNRFLYPPVIPLGIEYLGYSLRGKYFDVNILDLCFSQDPMKDIEKTLKVYNPDFICIAIRNIDSALYPNSEFYLPEIKNYVKKIRTLTDVPIIIGGAGLSAGPQEIITYIEADIAIVGPAEETLPEVLSSENLFKENKKIIKGKLPAGFCPERPEGIDYTSYIEKGGILGFETHKGCTSSCSFCIEAGTSVVFRKPSDVICELRQLADKGFNHFHLCDSEFNDDLDYCIGLLNAMARERLGIKWALYMKPGNYNNQMFRLLKESGAYLITLSVDTFKRCPEYWNDVEKIVFLAKRSGIKISIDFLAGFPHETIDTLLATLDSFRRIGTDEVVVNTFIRIYPDTKIRRLIDGEPDLKEFLIRTAESDKSYLPPVFYNHIPVEQLKGLIGGEKLFRIAGEQMGVNYQRAITGKNY